MQNKRRPKIRQHSQRSTPAGEHRPVMLSEVLEALDPRPGEVAADCTLGLAGHAVPILGRLGPTGRLIGLDWDAENLSRAAERLEKLGYPYVTHAKNFAGLPSVLNAAGLPGVDLIVADLGVSSVQIDDAARGFSYVRDGPLDMRMDRTRGRTAAAIIQSISEPDLANALRQLADEPAADQIAQVIVTQRERMPIESTLQLARLVGDALGTAATRDTGWRLHPRPGQWNSHPAARLFQTLRLLVNRELANLQELLRVLPQCLRPGGRAAIISFHSGEDRLIKSAFRDGHIAGTYGAASDEPIRASESEKRQNPRSRSAKLRWAKKSLDE